jgi:hypothetical protein
MKKLFKDTLYWLAARDAAFFQIIIGWMIVVAGLVITFYFGRSADLHCERGGVEQIHCSITQKLLGFQPLSESRVSLIQMAEVEESIGSDGDSTYRVVFVTSNDRVALTSYFSSDYAPKADLMERINAFIHSDQQFGLDVQEEIVWWKWLFFIGFTGLGAGMILVSLKEYLR